MAPSTTPDTRPLTPDQLPPSFLAATEAIGRARLHARAADQATAKASDSAYDAAVLWRRVLDEVVRDDGRTAQVGSTRAVFAAAERARAYTDLAASVANIALHSVDTLRVSAETARDYPAGLPPLPPDPEAAAAADEVPPDK